MLWLSIDMMSQERLNCVRDRTLVLRVLVPGLHTSLNDKINSKKEGGDDIFVSSSLSSAAGAGAPSGGGPQRTGSSADQLLNLDGVTCLPSQSGSTLWHFRCDGATYPARLVNLPCPVEVHKTHDNANYHKAADVGQMLIVYEDEYAMEEVENEKGYKVDGWPAYFHSGLTPPMRRVVQHRYLSRFEERDTKPLPPPKTEVSMVEKEIQHLITKLSTGKGKQKRSEGETPSTKDKIIEEVEEEIVDYEPWMGEGGVFTVDDAKIYPECWLSKSELKEIDAAKRSAEEDRRRREQEAERAAKEKEEEEKKKQVAKAAKKKKKKDKKKKKHEEEAAATAAVDKKVKESLTDEIDEVTAAAMTINQGIAGDEDFLFDVGGDDMFDFDTEDITDLLG